MNEANSVLVYADGAASPNPGRGGYGVVIIHEGNRREFSGGFRATTNNRMELMGTIVGLRTCQSINRPGGEKPSVVLYSDAKYVVDMFNGGYASQWRANGWTRNKGRDKACNPDLWAELLTLAEQYDLRMEWVKGHASNVENSRCDELAVAARQGDDLPPDPGYEAPSLSDLPVIRQATFLDCLNC